MQIPFFKSDARSRNEMIQQYDLTISTPSSNKQSRIKGAHDPWQTESKRSKMLNLISYPFRPGLSIYRECYTCMANMDVISASFVDPVDRYIPIFGSDVRLR
jgi:hypothetical protein